MANLRKAWYEFKTYLKQSRFGGKELVGQIKINETLSLQNSTPKAVR